MAHRAVEVREKVELTEQEARIFRRLLDVVQHFKLDTQLRVAGGWVRDKLLGKDCYDIDIALDNMLGREFCEKVNEYLSSEGEQQAGIGVIQSNPDQSKHLETARMHIFDTWIDFVNLRSETYAENSRIPEMKFGTAEEDAKRRDLTINSMFFNINTNSVEDLTGRGMRDLKSGYIVTPLHPKSTFLDDPLRVLRAIRFGARFEFELDDELQKAAADEEVRAALAEKISRERIGHEIDLMISGNQPIRAITYICNLQLFYSVFTFPENPEPAIAEGCDSLGCLTGNRLPDIHSEDEQRRIYLYASLFLSLRNVIYVDRKSKKIPIASYIIRSSLKLKANDADMVVGLHCAAESFVSLISFLELGHGSPIVETEAEDELLDLDMDSKRRILVGLLLRQTKDLWRVALLLSTLMLSEGALAGDGHSRSLHLNRSRETFVKVEKVVIELGLEKVWEMKPLLDGKAIMGVLQLKTGGPQIKEWQQRVLKWQLARPNGSADECLDWMKQCQNQTGET